jgi:hypothetical protein
MRMGILIKEILRLMVMVKVERRIVRLKRGFKLGVVVCEIDRYCDDGNKIINFS